MSRQTHFVRDPSQKNGGGLERPLHESRPVGAVAVDQVRNRSPYMPLYRWQHIGRLDGVRSACRASPRDRDSAESPRWIRWMPRQRPGAYSPKRTAISPHFACTTSEDPDAAGIIINSSPDPGTPHRMTQVHASDRPGRSALGHRVWKGVIERLGRSAADSNPHTVEESLA